MQAQRERNSVEPSQRRWWPWAAVALGTLVYVALVIANIDRIIRPLGSGGTNAARIACALFLPGAAVAVRALTKRSSATSGLAIAWLVLGGCGAIWVLLSPADHAHFLRSELERLHVPDSARPISQSGGDDAFSGAGSFAASNYCVSGDPNIAVGQLRTAALDLEEWDPPRINSGTDEVGQLGVVSVSVWSDDVATQRGADSSEGSLARECGPGEDMVVTVQLNGR